MATVAVLGTGIMGAPMARNLVAGGFSVRVWNRTIDKAKPLADEGVVVCRSPQDAGDGADFVLTMLSDVDAVTATVDGDDEPFTGAGSPVWLQMSTVGVDGTKRLASLAADRGVRFVDAPVLGTRQPAEKGALTVLASGDDALREQVQPVFDAVGSRTLWLGPAGQGSRLKLVVNSWVLALTSATAEAIALAQGLGLDPHRFLDAIEGGPLDVQYAHVKGEAMIRGEFPAAFPVDGALKDAAHRRSGRGSRRSGAGCGRRCRSDASSGGGGVRPRRHGRRLERRTNLRAVTRRSARPWPGRRARHRRGW